MYKREITFLTNPPPGSPAPSNDNQVIFAGPCKLHTIIVGAGGTGTLEVSNSKTDGDGNLKIKLTNPPTGEYPCYGAEFDIGLTVDVLTIGDITLVWERA